MTPLENTEANEPYGRVRAFGNQLIEVHIWLREELEQLHEDVDAYLDGHGGLPRKLQAHCLTFCSAVHRHHTGEDGGAFLVLADQFPELRPVLEELKRDHNMVSWLLGNLQKLLSDLGPESDPASIRAELDGLSSLLETHFTYEERQLVSALNAVSRPDWDVSKPDFLLVPELD
jgi:hypothetical protein